MVSVGLPLDLVHHMAQVRVQVHEQDLPKEFPPVGVVDAHLGAGEEEGEGEERLWNVVVGIHLAACTEGTLHIHQEY